MGSIRFPNSQTPVASVEEPGVLVMPRFSHLEPGEAKAQFALIVSDLFENPDLYLGSKEFPPEWFDQTERFLEGLSRTGSSKKQINSSRRAKPVREKSAQSQARIVSEIFDLIEVAKDNIASKKPSKTVSTSVGKLVWIGSNGCGGRGIRRNEKDGGVTTYDADFAVIVPGALNCSGLRCIRNCQSVVYEMSAAQNLNENIGVGIDLVGGGTLTLYDGNEDQQPPAAIEAVDGMGNTPGYRGRFVAVFTKFPISDPGQQIPELSFEYITECPPDRAIANNCGVQIAHLFIRLQRETDLAFGQIMNRSVRKGGAGKKLSNQADRDALQKHADKIWLQSPNYLSKEDVADKLKEMFDLKKKNQAIRKAIKRPAGAPGRAARKI